MIVREQVDRTKNLHPKVKAKWNEMTQLPEPLKFKLHQVEQKEAAESTYDLFETYKDFHVNEPMVPLEPLPFAIERTHKSNLPVYTEYKLGG